VTIPYKSALDHFDCKSKGFVESVLLWAALPEHTLKLHTGYNQTLKTDSSCGNFFAYKLASVKES
jgi:hypothetical protein